MIAVPASGGLTLLAQKQEACSYQRTATILEESIDRRRP
jgi:hypothetical protein